ncbi:AIG1 domain-containing protein [Rhizoctonia solani AG-1 IA]|uniref:AIG1 domain-containing protein n=1 Tax=Thanatephorus cucumeris (strain AG1-IA) TaxID=983506 RepID=L8WQQ9_THACA|nr:AIG1 domain-containing protein [Rhizoctonia solani AG-1 IA]
MDMVKRRAITILALDTRNGDKTNAKAKIYIGQSAETSFHPHTLPSSSGLNKFRLLSPTRARMNWVKLNKLVISTRGELHGPLKLPEDKNSITIVMVGETGCGKTAFMSLLQNLFQGRSALELEDLHDKTTDSNLKKSCSQTEKAKLYELKTPGGEFTIRMLDTPGLGDSRGLDQDKVNQKEITNAISQLGTIDAVVIMSNGTTERLGPVTAYALQTLVTIFPRDILENIGFIYTHTRPLSFNFQPDSLPPELKKSPYWLVENPLALIVKHNAMAQNETHA